MISARTGLGVAGLYWDGFRHHPFACEGGHTDFAPRNDLEVELFRYILKKHGHVSSERVLSGPGIKNIYDFLRDSKKAEEPAWLKEQMDKIARRAGPDIAGGAGKESPDLRADFCYFCEPVRGQDRGLRSDLHVHGRNFHLRHHCREKSEQDAGPRLHGSHF